MKKNNKVTIEIDAQFGSKFQSQFAHDSLFNALKAWKYFLHKQHKNNAIDIKINGDKIYNLDTFNWQS